jgi:hypothetical protein
MKGYMKKPHMIGIVAVAIATAVVVIAADQKPSDSALVRLKSGGQTIAELRILETGGAFSLRGSEQVEARRVVKSQGVMTLPHSTLEFGGPSGRSVIIQAEEMELLLPDGRSITIQSEKMDFLLPNE